MKKSKAVKLVLVAGLLASCSNNKKEAESRLYVRGDSVSSYTQTPHTYGGGMGYYHFMPYGYYRPNYGYYHGGYESSAFSSRATSSHVSRGGFGTSGARVGG
jgi:hypothetical protein